MPDNCRKYVEFIEQFLNVDIEWIGVGPERSAMIRKENGKKVELEGRHV